MSYIVKDKYHKLIINLTTKLQNYLNIYINAYATGRNSPYSLVPSSIIDNEDGTKTLIFELRNKYYEIGTEFTSFKAVLGGTHKLVELNEGVSILVDGNESLVKEAVIVDDEGEVRRDSQGNIIWTENLKRDAFAVEFDDNEPHTVQAIYKGNNEIGVAVSDKFYIKPQQHEDDGQQGHFTLTSNVPKTFKYMDTPNWTWTLKKGGTPVPNRTIEKVLPTSTYSADTNSKGQVHQGLPTSLAVLAKWVPGNYTIIANFYHYEDTTDPSNKILLQCKNKITIVKNTPTLKYVPSEGKGKKFALALRDPQKQPMPNKTINFTVNGKKYSKKTNSNGNIWFKTNVKGRYKGSATFAGNKYYNKKTIKFDQVIR